MKRDTPAYDELEALLEANGYKSNRVAVIPDELWKRLRRETFDPFNTQYRDERRVLWYKNWTMLFPRGMVLEVYE